MSFLLRPPPRPPGRVLACTACRTVVEVYEFPEGWIAPEAFVCGECHRPPLEARLRAVPDPAVAKVPF